jgi:ABC-type polysaccharide/polyol phosphate transport system ATPase subunit
MKKQNILKRKYAIVVEDIDKFFWIPDEKISSLKAYFTNPLNIFKNKSRKFQALSDVSFKIRKGEFVGVIGRNGSGKSTLLKLIAGIYTPEQGKITINGSLVPFLELGVGFNPELSAKENIFLNGAILGMSRKVLQSKVDEILEFAGVQEFAEAPIKNFSSGMVIRLAFAIAIQAKADIYLLDEVLSVGDQSFRVKSMNKMNELIDSGATVLYVSHDLDTVEQLTDRAIFLEAGKIIADGSPKEVVENFKLSLMAPKQREQYLKSKEGKAHHMSAQNVEQLLQLSDLNRDVGDGRAEITKVAILDENEKELDELKLGQKFKLLFEAKINKAIENPVAYIGIRKEWDRQLFELGTEHNGSNSLKSLKAGDKVRVIFEVQNILNPGVYSLWVQLGEPATKNGVQKTQATLVRYYSEITVTEKGYEGNLNLNGPIQIQFSYKTKVN